MGGFLFSMFSLIQLMWIEALFLAMSLPIKSKTQFLPMLLQTLGGEILRFHPFNRIISGFLIISISFLIFFKMMCFEMDSLYRSFKRIRLLRPSTWEERQADIEEVMDIIDDAEPISGCGMFSITRSTLTSMLSTSVTYLIILIQFKLAL